MTKEDIQLYIRDNSAIFPGDAEFMFDEISKLQTYGNLLEIGTGYGHSTAFFSQLKPEWTIYTIDGFGEYGTIPQYFTHKSFDPVGFMQTKGYIESNANKNVIQIIGNSKELKWHYPVDVLFIDADHTFEGVKSDFNTFSHYAKMIFFHDYDLDMEGNDINTFIDTLKNDWEITAKCHTAKAVRKNFYHHAYV